MSWLDNVFARLGYFKAAQLPAWLSASVDAERWAMPSGESVEKQVDLYRKLTWLQIAISHVSEMAAAVPFNVKRLEGEDEIDIPNHPFEMLLRRPNDMQSRSEFLAATFAFRQITGNAYWWLNRANENEPPAELWIIPSQKIKPVPDGKLFVKGYLYESGMNESILLPTWSVCHFKRFNPSSLFSGLSAVEAMGLVGGGDLAMQQWNANHFGKNNAKIQGALAFADFVNDPDWERMKSDMRKNWGGTNRSGPMMLRGAGKSGVEWLPMMLSQREMEFIESRKMNKEEIYALFAPGLSSMLEVNTTEANAIAGKATLMELGVYPLLSMVAEKITNDVLPVYGEDLVGEFDDPRQSNRLLDLQEQERYEKTHTIDEIRAEYYGDDSIGDERGSLLPAEVRVVASSSVTTNYSDANNLPPPHPPPDMSEDKEPMESADMKRWERKCIKAVANGKVASSVKFVSETIDAARYAAIADGLQSAVSVEEVEAVFESAMTKARGEPKDAADRRRREKAMKREMAKYFEGLQKRIKKEVKA
jgi:HK97 family phage portal protein